MEIKLNTNVDPIGRLPGSQPKKVEPQAQTGVPEFSHSEGLNKVMQQTDDVRAEKVSKAREAIENSDYPPRETIKKIATLLAANIAKEKSNVSEL